MNKKYSFVFPREKNETRSSNLSLLIKFRARHRKDYLARVKTAKFEGGGGYSIPVMGTVYFLKTNPHLPSYTRSLLMGRQSSTFSKRLYEVTQT